MIPILFSETEQNFTSNGIGRLTEALSCVVTEERNGQYTLSMTYPVQGKWFKELKHSRYIFATPSDGASKQPFRIYKISKPLNGKVTVLAQHRSYQLSGIPCGPFTASNVSAALQGLKDNAYETCDFTFWTDKSTIANYKQDEPSSIRSRLGGVQGSILDVYGGEFEFDNLTVKLHANRGVNNGVTLRYGKNITDINQEINIENTITGVCPFARDQSGNVIELPEHVVYSPNASNFPEPKDAVIDFTEEFGETTPTVSALRAKANAYITANNIGVPAVNIKVSFVALWQTEEYKDVAVLERVKLCDTVTVYFEKLGIEATAKVIKTEYDVLKDRYQSIELGEGRTNLALQIADINTEVKQKANVSAMQQAIDAATTLISGGLGGHVVFNRNANGEPEEILIMDTDDISTAVNVIRMNQNGIGFSTTGYNGPFTTAWTIDSHFNADFINAGTITGVAINNGNGTFTVDSGGALVASNATIKSDDSVGRTEIENGTLTTYSALNGNKGFRIYGSTLNIYAWDDDGNRVGGVGSTYKRDTGEHFTALWCDHGDIAMLGYKATDETETITKAVTVNEDNDGEVRVYRRLVITNASGEAPGLIKSSTFSNTPSLFIGADYGKQLVLGFKKSDNSIWSSVVINGDSQGSISFKINPDAGAYRVIDANNDIRGALGQGTFGNNPAIFLRAYEGKQLRLGYTQNGVGNSSMHINTDGSVEITRPCKIYNSLYYNYPVIGTQGVNGEQRTYGIFWNTNISHLSFIVDGTTVLDMQSNTSDKRKKKNIELIDDNLSEAVGSVDLIQFQYIEDMYGDHTQVGVIAQDVREACEDAGVDWRNQNIVYSTKERIAPDGSPDEKSDDVFHVDYTQFLIARLAHDEKRISKMEEEIELLKEEIKLLKGER